MTNLAPIVLFTYNRIEHTKKTIEALQRNPLAEKSNIFIFNDGGKNDKDWEKVNKVRQYIKKLSGFEQITIFTQKENLGLATSIEQGVTKIINQYGKVIVLEDDIVTGPYFLKFMNESLNRYKNENSVWHISAWNYPLNKNSNKTFLWRVMNCWGWATWKDRWKHYEKKPAKLIKSFSEMDIYKFNLEGTNNFWQQIVDNNSGNLNTWAIFWYATIFKNNGLCLNPVQTHVNNIGFDTSGTNCTKIKDFIDTVYSRDDFKLTNKIKESSKYLRQIKALLAKKNAFLNINIKHKNLNKYEKETIIKTLNRQKAGLYDDLTQMWHLLDTIWDDYLCDNENLNWENVAKYYSHPVWLLNGLFIEQHPLSIQHRKNITKWIKANNFENILDFGGGFGTLASYISKKTDIAKIDIFEPHPSEFGIKRLKKFDKIKIISKLNTSYSCVVSTDVLEHIENPIETFCEMIKHTKENGYLIIANCFEPVIKCHLPSTFHLKYSFDYFTKQLGLIPYGNIEGSHAKIYKKASETMTNYEIIKAQEDMSKYFYSILKETRVSTSDNSNLTFNNKLNILFNHLELLNKNKNTSYILYGSGRGAQLILSQFNSYNIKFIIDKDQHKHKQQFMGKTIYHIAKLHQYKNEKIIISVFGREEEIKEELSKSYNIPFSNIITLIDK